MQNSVKNDFNKTNTIVLFDVDGTLTPARQKASSSILNLLQVLRGKVCVGIVGGSDIKKNRRTIGRNSHK